MVPLLSVVTLIGPSLKGPESPRRHAAPSRGEAIPIIGHVYGRQRTPAEGRCVTRRAAQPRDASRRGSVTAAELAFIPSLTSLGTDLGARSLIRVSSARPAFGSAVLLKSRFWAYLVKVMAIALGYQQKYGALGFVMRSEYKKNRLRASLLFI